MAKEIHVIPLVESKTVEYFDCDKIVQNVNDMEIINLGQQDKVLSRICSEAIAEASQYFQLSPSSKQSSNRQQSVSELSELLFYKLVQGGNVAAITTIFDQIQNDHPLLYQCLLEGRKPERDSTVRSEVQPSMSSWKIINTLICFFILLPLFLIAIPFIYLILYIGSSRSVECYKAENMKLPLFLATLSNNVSMVEVFKERYPTILKATDDFSNNIFHLIAIISKKDNKIALGCFRLLLQTFNISEVKDVLMDMRNESSLNGLECAVKVGSPLYFTEILETEGILKTTVLAISKGNIYDGRKLKDNGEYESVIYKPDTFEAYTVAHYDISRYEKGDVFIDQSFLLTLLCDRELMDMTEKEVDSIDNNPLLKKWMHTKIEMNFLSLSFLSGLNCLVWTMLIYYAMRADSEGYPDRLKAIFWEAYRNTNETIQLSDNEADCSLSEITSNYSADLMKKFESMCQMKKACGYDVLLSVTNQSASSDWRFLDCLAIICISSCYSSVCFDIYLRAVFFSVQYHQSDWQVRKRLLPFLRRIFTRRMQVCYVSTQLNVTSGLFLCAAYFLYFIIRNTYPVDQDSADTLNSLLLLLDWNIVAGIGFRAFSILYLGRIYNIGSYFIISMWKLQRTLYQFLAMYTVIGFMFAVLFTYVAFDPICPLKKIPPFGNFFGGYLAIFRIMLGDSVMPSEMNDRLSVTYAVYVVVATVVMMSLFTGISGSVADRVLSAKLKGPLLLKERLEESINAETTLLLLLLPFRKTVQKWLLMREKHGAKVMNRDNENEFSVILEVDYLRP